jgi:hypothetical protein
MNFGKIGAGIKSNFKKNGGVGGALRRVGEASPHGALFGAVNKFRDWKSNRPKSPTKVAQTPGSATTAAFGVTKPKQGFVQSPTFGEKNSAF